MTDLVSWALSGTQRPPTNTELSEGFDCNLPPRDLFNWWNNLNALTAGNRHLSATAIQNDPPGGPSNGDTYIVGDTPTGAWASNANDIAVFVDAAWVFLTPKPWLLVGLADKADWRWDDVAGEWVQWQATTTVRGPVRLAVDKDDATGVPTMALLKAEPPAAIFAQCNDQTIPHNVDSRISDFASVSNTLTNSTFASGVLTIGAGDEGRYLITATARILAAIRINLNVFVNGAPIAVSQSSTSADGVNQGLACTVATEIDLSVGDTTEILFSHSNTSASAAAITGSLSRVAFSRQGGLNV